ncbi:MAG: hypothetical protein EPN79_16030 [Burkholderiaceae bacterium]|nr:MAG: hypothetical protein EPN79_16030 [Burkholderiaceae bacterium]
MSMYEQFMAAVGSPDLAASGGYLHYRESSSGDAGVSADIELVDGDIPVVVVSVWEWVAAERGPERSRLGRVEFDPATGAVRSHDGDVAELARLIATLERMEG